jgi:predicted TIM-barrel fold metal-dependent hydrolase
MERQFKHVISADSHTLESLDMWSDALGDKFGDETPRKVDELNGEKGRFFFNGTMVQKVGASEADAEERYRLDAGYDPEIRVKFQMEAGVESEVLHPTRLLSILHHPNQEVMRACCRVYNDWVLDFSSYNRERLVEACVVPMGDIPWAEEELERLGNKGARDVAINLEPPEGCPPYRRPDYDRFWGIAEEMGIPLTLHIFSGKPRPHFDALPPDRQDENAEILLISQYEIAWILARDFILGTILDRFPKLKLIDAEFEVGWIPFFNWWVDRFQTAWGHRMKMPPLQMKASEYMSHRIWHGFIDDPLLTHALEFVSVDQLLWGSDFPHIRSLGLDTHERLPELLGGLSAEDQEKVLNTNAAQLWGL